LEIVPQQVLQTPNHKELYIDFLMSLLQALLNLDKEDLYSTFVHHLPVSILDTFPLNKQGNDIKTALSAMECEKGLLWSNFAKNFDCSSFLLSQELFVDINLLASGNLSGKRAQLIANEVSQSIDSCLVDSILVVKTSKEEEKLLVKTLKFSVICAIAELFIMDSNFSLVLQGMQFFSKLISAISEAEPKDISKRDFDTLLVKRFIIKIFLLRHSQSGDGYSWVIHLATNFLRIALSDSKPLLLIAGSQLIARIIRLPGGARSLIRDLVEPILGCHDDLETTDTGTSRLRKEAVDLVIEILLLCPFSEISFYEIVDRVIVPGLRDSKEAVSLPKNKFSTAYNLLLITKTFLKQVRGAVVDCLAVAVSLEGETLIDRVESQLSVFSQSNNNSSQEEKGAEENKTQGQQQNQEVRLLKILATLRSTVLQRQLPILDSQSRVVRPTTRKNSINGMSAMGHTNYEASSSAIGVIERRKPSAGRMHGNLRLPWDPRDSVVVVGYASGSPSSMDTDLYTSRPDGQLHRRSHSNQVPSLELDNQTDIRRSLNLSADSYHRINQTSPTRASYAGMGILPAREFSGSLTNLSLVSEGPAAAQNRSSDSSEVTNVRRRASQRRTLQVNTNLDSANSRLSDPTNGESPNFNRSPNRQDEGNQFFLNAPSIPLCLTTGRASIAHHQSPKSDNLSNHLKASTASIDLHSPHLRPLRGQHDIAKDIMLPSPQSDFDIVGRSVHPVGDTRDQLGKQEPNKDIDETDENTNEISGRTTVLENPTFATDDFKEEDESTLRADIEDHTLRSFRRSSRALQSDSPRSGSAQSKRRDEVDFGGSSRTCPQTPTRTPSSQRRSRRPPTCPRDSSRNRRSIRQQNTNDGSENAVFSRLSRNSSANLESATCRDVNTALSRISSSDWEDKVEGLLSLSSLALRNPVAFSTPSESYSAVIHSVISECKNLRSQVSRQAVKTLSDLFRGLGRLLDPQVDTCIRVLLGKTGEASAAFLRGEVAIALSYIIRSVNPNRALIALFQHGLGHKNAAVRRQCAIQVSYLIESLGANRVMQVGAGQRGGGLSSWGSTSVISSANPNAIGTTTVTSASSQAITERVIVALGKFLLDSNQETRYYGRRILATLQQSPDFDRIVSRYLSGQMLRAVREATEYLRTKGLGEPPTSVVSASCPKTATASDQVDHSLLQSRSSSAGGLGGGL
uniref:TOG domain-containing protein n=1 Tax=Hymenolepis diminuta TaxID=6216 RepID=A0A158QG25_HYMDI